MTQLLTLIIFSFSLHLYAASETNHLMVKASELKWETAPPSLPPGAKTAIVQGDPKAAGPFVMRIKLPAGYKISPHFHPADENVTVLEGAFWMGSGSTFEQDKMMELPPGGFARMTTGTHHYAMAKKATTIQLHGIGPWGITYINPADDPRKTK